MNKLPRPKVREEQRLESERARIQTEEELGVAEENKSRQILVAMRNKEKTDAVEQERVTRDRDLEATERMRVGRCRGDRERKGDRNRETQHPRSDSRTGRDRTNRRRRKERIKDTEEIAKAERQKKVQVTAAEMRAEEELIRANQSWLKPKRNSATLLAEKVRVDAEAKRDAAEKHTEATKMMAEER